MSTLGARLSAVGALVRGGGVRPLQLGAALLALVAVAVAVEALLQGPKDSILEAVALRGLGPFLWAFVALILALEWIRNRLASQVSATSEAVILAASNDGPGSMERVHDLYREESTFDPLLGRLAPDLDSFVARAQTDHAFVPRFLSRRARRLSGHVAAYLHTGTSIGAELGLLGTIVGMMGAIDSRIRAAKEVALVGGRYLAAQGNEQIATALSTTGAGCYVVLLVILMHLSLSRSTASLARQIEELERVRGLEQRALPVPRARTTPFCGGES